MIPLLMKLLDSAHPTVQNVDSCIRKYVCLLPPTHSPTNSFGIAVCFYDAPAGDPTDLPEPHRTQLGQKAHSTTTKHFRNSHISTTSLG